MNETKAHDNEEKLFHWKIEAKESNQGQIRHFEFAFEFDTEDRRDTDKERERERKKREREKHLGNEEKTDAPKTENQMSASDVVLFCEFLPAIAICIDKTLLYSNNALHHCIHCDNTAHPTNHCRENRKNMFEQRSKNLCSNILSFQNLVHVSNTILASKRTLQSSLTKRIRCSHSVKMPLRIKLTLRRKKTEEEKQTGIQATNQEQMSVDDGSFDDIYPGDVDEVLNSMSSLAESEQSDYELNDGEEPVVIGKRGGNSKMEADDEEEEEEEEEKGKGDGEDVEDVEKQGDDRKMGPESFETPYFKAVGGAPDASQWAIRNIDFIMSYWIREFEAGKWMKDPVNLVIALMSAVIEIAPDGLRSNLGAIPDDRRFLVIPAYGRCDQDILKDIVAQRNVVRMERRDKFVLGRDLMVPRRLKDPQYSLFHIERKDVDEYGVDKRAVGFNIFTSFFRNYSRTFSGFGVVGTLHNEDISVAFLETVHDRNTGFVRTSNPLYAVLFAAFTDQGGWNGSGYPNGLRKTGNTETGTKKVVIFDLKLQYRMIRRKVIKKLAKMEFSQYAPLQRAEDIHPDDYDSFNIGPEEQPNYVAGGFPHELSSLLYSGKLLEASMASPLESISVKSGCKERYTNLRMDELKLKDLIRRSRNGKVELMSEDEEEKAEDEEEEDEEEEDDFDGIHPEMEDFIVPDDIDSGRVDWEKYAYDEPFDPRNERISLSDSLMFKFGKESKSEEPQQEILTVERVAKLIDNLRIKQLTAESVKELKEAKKWALKRWIQESLRQ